MSANLTNTITRETTATQVSALVVRVGYAVQDANGNTLKEMILTRKLDTDPIPADLLEKIENQCRIHAEENY